MRGAVSLAGAAALLLPVACRPPEPRRDPASAAARFIVRAEAGTALEHDTRALSALGPRLTGSEAGARAEEWAAARLREAAVPVDLEPVAVPSVWQPGLASGRCLGPEAFPLQLAAAPGSPPTPGTLTARLVDAGTGMPGDLARLGGAAEGAVALIAEAERSRTVAAPWLAAAVRAGLAAVLVRTPNPDGLIERLVLAPDVGPLPLAVAVVTSVSFDRLRGALAHGKVSVEVTWTSGPSGPASARNVVATIRGRDEPGEIVLLGAHLDSWDLGTGASDNGVNAALVIDVARALRELGLAPRRTVRFALFTGEEQGLVGSRSYVAAHAAEMNGHVLAVIFDLGSGPVRGFYLNGRKSALREVFQRILSPEPGWRGLFGLYGIYRGTDSFAFVEAGIPVLAAFQDLESYRRIHHTASDTVGGVDFASARRNAALAAALIWGAAEDPAPMPPRMSSDDVRALLIRHSLAVDGGSAR